LFEFFQVKVLYLQRIKVGLSIDEKG